MFRHLVPASAHRRLIRTAMNRSISRVSSGFHVNCYAIRDNVIAGSFFAFSRSFSTQEPAKEGKEAKEAKEKKPKKSWLQVWTDMEFRNVVKPLEAKYSKNSERQKARKEQLRCLLPLEDLHRSRLHMTDSTRVYVKQYNTKDPYVEMTYGEALAQAKAQSLDLVCFERVLSRPAKPEQMAAIQDDGVPVFVWMNFRAFADELNSVDTAATKGVQEKDVNLSPGTTGNDLYRKVYQALDMLFEGNAVRFHCKARTNAKVQRDVLESLGLKDEEELKSMVDKFKETDTTATLAESAAAYAKAAAERAKKAAALAEMEGKRAMPIPVAADDDEEEGGIAGGDGGSKKVKLSKKEIEMKAERDKLKMMSSREKIAHLAATEASVTYPVLWDIVETFAKLGAIIHYNRRVNGGKPLTPPSTASPATTEGMSKKERRRAEAIAAQTAQQSADPYTGIKYELELAKKALESKAPIDDESYSQMLKKNLLVGYETLVERDNVVRTNTLHVKLGKF